MIYELNENQVRDGHRGFMVKPRPARDKAKRPMFYRGKRVYRSATGMEYTVK